MWSSIADHREGVGFFADPIAKPSLFTYWWTLTEMSYSALFLRYKIPTEEGFAAASNSPSPAWDADSVMVSRGLMWYGCGAAVRIVATSLSFGQMVDNPHELIIAS